ncbi:MAG: rod shape-determining protein MreC [Candidatus Paceibacterota bacterium]
MSYLLDKKIKRKKFLNIALFVAALIILFYFRVGIFNGFSSVSQVLFRPILIVGQNVGEKFKSIGSYFISKNYLYNQNQKLQAQVDFNNARNSNYDSVVAENVSLKEILNRKGEKASMILATILSKPNQSIYDTLIIDAGAQQGIKEGDIVFALGNVPIGRVSLVYDNSSKVTLFSSTGEKTQVIISSKDVFLELIGRGGGNFEMILPRDFTLQKGDQVSMSGIYPYVLAEVVTTISDLRDPVKKILLTSLVNIQGLKFVEVEI